MKKYFYSIEVKILSVFMGVLAFVAASFFVEIQLAIIAGLLSTLGLSVTVPFILHFTDKRYKGIESNISGKILIKENVGFRHGRELRNGYIYITVDKLYFFSRDKKPYLEECLCKDDIFKIELENDIYLNIYVKQKDVYTFISRKCKEIIIVLLKHNWIEL